MDKLADIWDEICALDTLTDIQKYHVDCAAVQFYDIAYNVYYTVYKNTRDDDVLQKARSYKSKWNSEKKIIGL